MLSISFTERTRPKRKESTRMSIENRINTRSSRKKSRKEVLFDIGNPVFVRKSSGSSEKFRAVVIAHVEHQDTPTTKTGVIVEYEDGERGIERILFDSNRLIPCKKDPSVASFGRAANISEKGSDSNVDLTNFRQHYSELHTNVLPPRKVEGYCKETLSFETFTTMEYELQIRLDLRTKKEGYLDDRNVDLRTY